MIRHFFAGALRNLAQTPLQSAIAIGGLAIGLAAAILAGLIVQNQVSFDHFLPDHDRIYLAATESTLGGRPTDYFDATPHDLAARLKQIFPEIEKIARVKDNTHALRRGEVEAQETIYSADFNIFEILRLPVLYGDLDGALDRPDSIVLPLSMARKYFGRDDVVGQTLQLDRQHILTVTAVLADLPTNGTMLKTAIFTSGRAAGSDIALADKNPPNGPNGGFGLDLSTLMQLRPGADLPALQARMLDMSESLLPRPRIISANLRLMRLDDFHLSPDYHPGIRDRLIIFSLVALLVLFLSCVNFINLSTARAARRGIEVGVRKAAGASRHALMAQFLGESILHTVLALCIAVAIVEWSLPAVNAFLDSGALFDYWRNPVLVLALLLVAILVGVLAGAYPALVMSSFRPAAVLKGLMAGSSRAVIVRQILVTAQFAVLILLAVATGVVLQQHRFALAQAMRFNTDQLLFVSLPRCETRFKEEVAALPGVRGVACSNIAVIQQYNFALVRHPDGTSTALYLVGAAPGLLEFFGQRMIAGRDLRASDRVDDDSTKPDAQNNTVINETAVRKLGLKTAQAAIGRILHLQGVPGPVKIVGVVRDFSLTALETPIDAAAYYYRTRSGPADELLHIRLKGRDIPETLAAIDAAWNRTGASRPIERTFMNAYLENMRLPLLRQGQAIAVFSGIAVLLGCLGLFGLSISTAERRTKEIGVRKVMGASSADIVILLLLQFLKPVLWAILIAWPLAWWLMQRWLAGFAYHVALGPLPFIAAAGMALAVALLTVVTHAVLTARAVPATALRYE